MIYHPPSSRSHIQLDDEVWLPPRSIARIKVPCSYQYSSANTVQFNPANLTRPGIHFASSLSYIDNQQIIVEAINLNYHSDTLYPGMTIGTIHKYIPTDLNIPPKQIIDRKWISAHAKCSPELTSKQNETLIDLLCQFPALYATEDKDCGRTTLVEHQIDTGNNHPVRKFSFRTSPAEKEIITKEVQTLESKGVIEKSTSPWSTNIVLVRKKDGGHRMCIDLTSEALIQ